MIHFNHEYIKEILIHKAAAAYIAILYVHVILTYIDVGSVLEWVYDLIDDTAQEDDEHNDGPHPLPHDDPITFQPKTDRLG